MYNLSSMLFLELRFARVRNEGLRFGNVILLLFACLFRGRASSLPGACESVGLVQGRITESESYIYIYIYKDKELLTSNC